MSTRPAPSTVSTRPAGRAADPQPAALPAAQLWPDPAAAPFSAAHAPLRAAVRRWVSTEITPFVMEWEAARAFPSRLFAAAGAAGLLGHKYEPRWGGCGPDLLADAVVTEELARCGSGGVSAALGAAKDLAPYYVARYGTDEQRQRWLVPSVAGQAVAGLAVTEPGAGSDVAALRTAAHPLPGGGWRLTGEKAFCTNGARADWLLVAARTGESGWRGVSLFVVPVPSPGLSVSRLHTLGWQTSQTGLLHLDTVEVEPAGLLGAAGDGFPMIMSSFQWERLGLALGAVAGAAASLADAAAAVRGAREREQWWDLAHRVAAARALTYAALTAHVGGAEVVADVSGAKWLACDLAVEAAAFGLQVASRADEPRRAAAERDLRDARLGPIGGGAREVMADLVARSLPWATT